MCSTGRQGAKGDKKPLCPDMAKRCLNGGTFVSREVCACAPGWTGTRCGEGENYVYIRILSAIDISARRPQ